MKIQLIGQANTSGIGNHFDQYHRALVTVVPDMTISTVDFTQPQALAQAVQHNQADDVTISFVGSNLSQVLQGTCINWAVWESTRIPTSLRSVFERNLMWVPSHWAQKIAIANGLDQDTVAVVPEGVDGQLFYPNLNPKEKKSFRFLTIGKYESRKNILTVIQAFQQAFGSDPGVELIIKSDYFKDGEKKRQSLLSLINDYSCENIHLIWGHYSREAIAELYRSSDAFVLPTRAEAWGLPIIEAMACGIPVITTFYSGQTEFLQHGSSSVIKIPYELIPITDPEYQGYYPEMDRDYGLWADVRAADLAQAMIQTRHDSARYSAEAIKNSTRIREEFSWHNSAVKSLDFLRRRGVL